MTQILLLLAAYLLGAIPSGYLLVRITTGRDIRSVGSGNIGATNVLRTAGRTIGFITLLLDIAKGYLAVWLMAHLGSSAPFWLSAAAIAVMAGHAYSVFLRFKGGKAVASFIGAFLYLTPVPLLAVVFVLFVAVAVTRYVSLGSILAAGTFPLAVWLILHPPLPVLLASLLAGAFIVVRHKANILRIRAGNEHVLNLGGKR